MIIEHTHPIDQYGYERSDIDYYNLNNVKIATVVRPLKHLHHKRKCIQVDDISKDNIIKLIKQ